MNKKQRKQQIIRRLLVVAITAMTILSSIVVVNASEIKDNYDASTGRILKTATGVDAYRVFEAAYKKVDKKIRQEFCRDGWSVEIWYFKGDGDFSVDHDTKTIYISSKNTPGENIEAAISYIKSRKWKEA